MHTALCTPLLCCWRHAFYEDRCCAHGEQQPQAKKKTLPGRYLRSFFRGGNGFTKRKRGGRRRRRRQEEEEAEEEEGKGEEEEEVGGGGGRGGGAALSILHLLPPSAPPLLALPDSAAHHAARWRRGSSMVPDSWRTRYRGRQRPIVPKARPPSISPSISDCSDNPNIGERPGGRPEHGLELGDRLDRRGQPAASGAPDLPACPPDPLPPWAPKYIEVPRPDRCPSVWHFPARTGSQHEVPECWFCPVWADRRPTQTRFQLGVPARFFGLPGVRDTRRLHPYAVALIWADPSSSAERSSGWEYSYGRPRDWNGWACWPQEKTLPPPFHWGGLGPAVVSQHLPGTLGTCTRGTRTSARSLQGRTSRCTKKGDNIYINK